MGDKCRILQADYANDGNIVGSALESAGARLLWLIKEAQ